MSVQFHGHVSYLCPVATIVNIEIRSVIWSHERQSSGRLS